MRGVARASIVALCEEALAGAATDWSEGLRSVRALAERSLKGPLSIPQARTLATKFTVEDRAVAVDRILAGEKAAVVLADMTPFSAADPALLTAKERSAARVLPSPPMRLRSRSQSLA